MNNKISRHSTKIKVNISFEIEIDDLEDLQTGIQALCSSVSFPNIDSPDGKEYHPKWVQLFFSHTEGLADFFSGSQKISKNLKKVVKMYYFKYKKAKILGYD